MTYMTCHRCDHDSNPLVCQPFSITTVVQLFWETLVGPGVVDASWSANCFVSTLLVWYYKDESCCFQVPEILCYLKKSLLFFKVDIPERILSKMHRKTWCY